MKYLVTFKYTSFYEDEKENKIAKDTSEYEAKNLDELWKILEEEDYNDDIVAIDSITYDEHDIDCYMGDSTHKNQEFEVIKVNL